MRCWYQGIKCEHKSKKGDCRLVNRKKVTPCPNDIKMEKGNLVKMARASGNDPGAMHIYQKAVKAATETMELNRSIVSRMVAK